MEGAVEQSIGGGVPFTYCYYVNVVVPYRAPAAPLPGKWARTAISCGARGGVAARESHGSAADGSFGSGGFQLTIGRFSFPEWVNRVRPLAGVLLVGTPVYAVLLLYFAAAPSTTDVGYSPRQPVPFSHLRRPVHRFMEAVQHDIDGRIREFADPDEVVVLSRERVPADQLADALAE